MGGLPNPDLQLYPPNTNNWQQRVDWLEKEARKRFLNRSHQIHTLVATAYPKMARSTKLWYVKIICRELEIKIVDRRSEKFSRKRDMAHDKILEKGD